MPRRCKGILKCRGPRIKRRLMFKLEARHLRLMALLELLDLLLTFPFELCSDLSFGARLRVGALQ
jgi:hypothetical protein